MLQEYESHLKAHGLQSPPWPEGGREDGGKVGRSDGEIRRRLSDKEAAECLLALAAERAKSGEEPKLP